MNIFQQINERFFPNIQPIPHGVYQYQAPLEADFPYRLHLRLEEDGQGTLILNARTVLHLNQSAAEYAYHIIQQTPLDDISHIIAKRFRISRQLAKQDYQDMIDRLHALIDTPDLDPVTFLDFERSDPYSGQISAPYRLDCALTYNSDDKNAEDAAPHKRVKRELDTEEWKTILDKAWNAGIPHIVFTGGEPTLRDDLCDLIIYAEELGQVTGVLSNGLSLSNKEYLDKLLRSGLDHLMIVLNPNDETAWKAIKDIMHEDVFTTVHLTLTKNNIMNAEMILDRLVKLGVTSLSLSANDPSLNQDMQHVRHSAENSDLTLVWDLPVPYSSINPVALELSGDINIIRGAGKAWLYIEPDGDVLEAQGLADTLGNMLRDSWEEVWSKVPD